MQVLLGADGSTYSRLAEEILVRVPEWRNAQVTVAGVAPQASFGVASFVPGMGDAAAHQLNEALAVAARESKDYADAAVRRLNIQGVKATAAYLHGDPGQELLEFAERNHFDAIAIGSRGMGALQSFLLGSVARKLVSNAPCHVLVARSSRGLSAEESLAALDSAPKLAVVLGADGSAGSEKAAEFIRRQGPLAFQELTAVCAEPLGVVPAGIDPAAFVDLYQYDHERAEEIARRVAEDLGSCADRVDSATGLGRPGWVISEQAKARGSDLIVVGATRHGTIERFLIGSASYELATEAACSVLIIRPSKI